MVDFKLTPLVLASASVYRKIQLEKLGIPFICKKPNLDEDDLKMKLIASKKKPFEIANELSAAKAKTVAQKLISPTENLIIAGDQLIELEGEIIGKPKTVENAFIQLKKLNGKTHRLITCVSLLKGDQITNHTEISEIKMHSLNDPEIQKYISIDQPIDCAGSYKIESYGIALFEKIKTDDFTSIQGLPMLWLTQQLRKYEYEFFRS